MKQKMTGWIVCAVVTLITACNPADEQVITADALTETPGFRGIVGGNETGFETWKGVVGMWTMSGMYAGICTATLLSPEVVLSAGHCVYYPQQGIDYISNPGGLEIMGGSIIGEELYSYAKRVVKHPNWKGSLGRNAVDLSMVLLEDPIKDAETYRLREGSNPPVGETGWLVGYGRSSDHDEMSAGTHRAGQTTIRSVNSRTIGTASPTSTCEGDSGGPLFTEQNGEWMLTAVTSYGDNRCRATSVGYSVNVLTYTTWIKDTFQSLTGRELDDERNSSTDIDVDGDADTDSDKDVDTDVDTDTDADSDGDTDGVGDGGFDDTGSTEGCGCAAAGGRHGTSLVHLFWELR